MRLRGRFGNKKPDLGRIRAAIADLSDEFLDALPDETPPLWLPATELTKLKQVIEKLKERRDKIYTWFPTLEAWL